MRRLRITSQWVFALWFLYLFMQTRYLGEDVISFPVNTFFRLDLLAAVTAMFADRTPLIFFWPLILVVPATLVFGRFFCGWICPVGGFFDLIGRFSQDRAPDPMGSWYRVKEVVLVFLLAASVLSLNLAGVVDPLSLAIRSLAMGIVPPAERVVTALFDGAYRVGEPVSTLSEPVYGWLADNLLSFQQPAFRYTALFALIVLLLVLLELRERRFWCRNLCPLGALYGWLAAHPPLGLKVGEGCTGCGACPRVCPMGAIEGQDLRSIRGRDCVLCYDCQGECPVSVINHGAAAPAEARPSPSLVLSRRQFLMSTGAGVTLPLVTGPLTRAEALPDYFVRPPGAVAESRFVGLCLRCGECMRVCLTNGLQPALFEAGIEGFWTPRLVSRLGYCEYSCTLCGQVCPTGAIRHLDTVEKRKVRIGTAIIDRNQCIPFIRPEQCIVCEEHCPTPEKAIVFDDVSVPGPEGPVTVKQPRVLEDICIGCGICETRCPVEGQSAVRIIWRGEDRSKDG